MGPHRTATHCLKESGLFIPTLWNLVKDTQLHQKWHPYDFYWLSLNSQFWEAFTSPLEKHITYQNNTACHLGEKYLRFRVRGNSQQKQNHLTSFTYLKGSGKEHQSHNGWGSPLLNWQHLCNTGCDMKTVKHVIKMLLLLLENLTCCWQS